MHNIKEIRKDFNVFSKSLEKRAINVDFKNLQKLDNGHYMVFKERMSLVLRVKCLTEDGIYNNERTNETCITRNINNDNNIITR